MSYCSASTASGAGGLAGGERLTANSASMRASNRSVLARSPIASAKSRARSGLTTATPKPTHARTTPIGFGQKPDRLGKEPCTQWIDDRDPKAACVQHPMHLPMPFAGGLDRDEPYIVLCQPLLELPVSPRFVGYAQRTAFRQNMNIE